MKYISKGLVVEGSTEHILKIQRGGYEFQLTGDRARLWLNGRFGVADADGTNPRYVKELLHLKRVGWPSQSVRSRRGVPGHDPVRSGAGQGGQAPGAFERPGKPDSPVAAGSWAAPDHGGAGVPAGTRYQTEPQLLGEENRQALTETIYTQETIFDNVLEAQMERASCREEMVRAVLGLLKKKRIVLL